VLAGSPEAVAAAAAAAKKTKKKTGGGAKDAPAPATPGDEGGQQPAGIADVAALLNTITERGPKEYPELCRLCLAVLWALSCEPSSHVALMRCGVGKLLMRFLLAGPSNVLRAYAAAAIGALASHHDVRLRYVCSLNYCSPVCSLNYCLPVSTTVCLPQLLSACLPACLN
jgi:hypothetical protein